MDHTLLDERRIFVRGRTRSLRASALIDGDVDKDTAGLHVTQHLAGDQAWSPSARHENRTDEQINIRQNFLQVRLVGVKRVRRVQRNVEKAHALEINLQNRHIRSKPLRHARSIDSRSPAADHHHFARQDTRHPAEQHAGPALVLGQQVGPDHHGHTTGNFAHWLEQGQMAVDLDRFVSQSSHPAFHQGLGQHLVRREVQISEKHLPLA